MNKVFGFVLNAVVISGALPALAQERIYRCGNEYTNTVPAGQKNACKLISGGNVTVVQKQSFVGSTKSPSGNAVREVAPRVGPSEQRARDADARQILESELQKIAARQQELSKTYNNGEPEKIGVESRNHQKYLDRVAGLKAEMDRNDSDMAGVQRELDRLNAQARSSGSK